MSAVSGKNQWMARAIPMLLSGPMVRAFIEGRKTQTRRLSNRFDAQPGDLIWFKETFATCAGAIYYRATDPLAGLKWKPSIFMPKAVCRCWAEIIEVRQEKLHDITHDGAVEEGFPDKTPARWSYEDLWKSLHNKPGTTWDDNPTVFVFTFEKIKP